MPLILPVHLICNTSDEEIFENIRQNSRLKKKWQQIVPAHDGVAILCGSGPSLADCLPQIAEMAEQGGKIFAMNGAAKFLHEHGIFADYQVIIDAREQTADLIGPAKEHLLASQVHPECFRRAPNAKIWHLQVGGIESLFPYYNDDYCLIGGAASVGNTATCLAYAMGYRCLEIFGYDSSHRDGLGHAFSQPMNEGDPCALVEFCGKEYLCSFTMKLQAEKFAETSRALQQVGCVINMHGSGLLPDMFNAAKEDLSEQEKYERMWAKDEYRIVSPGEHCVESFLEIAKPSGLVIDFGCGTGRAALKINESGCDVLLVDFTENSRDPSAKALDFIKHDLKEPISVFAIFGYCTDVMEHIPPEDVDTVLASMFSRVNRVFFQISTVPDQLGSLIGHDLHLTVKPHSWWRGKFLSFGFSVEWEEEREDASLFYVFNSSVDAKRPSQEAA